MTISLYDASVTGYLQMLEGVSGFMAVSEAHFLEKGVDLAEIVETRLIEDMAKFRFQVVSVHHHTAGGAAALLSGEFGPPTDKRPHDWAALRGLVDEAKTSLTSLTADEINARAGQDVTFRMGDYSRAYTAENFLLSFSLPNLYFHATTAYDILRMKGAPIGKRDFGGPQRIKG